MDKKKHADLQRLMAKNLSGYVLITCEEPNAEGEMPIDMVYHGDEALISYLLHNAQSHVDQIDEESELCPSHANIRLVK